MGRRKVSERVYGPYKHKKRWRILFLDGDGGQSALSFATEGEAQTAADELRARLQGLTVKTAIEEYQAHQLGELRLEQSSVDTTGYRLRSLLQVDATRTGGLVADLTPRRARILVEGHKFKLVHPKKKPGEARAWVTRPRSYDYRLGALKEAGQWAAWCRKRGYLSVDPFAGIELVGEKKHGKKQLRGDEAIAFETTALTLFDQGEHNALAAALLVDLGDRATEIAESDCRDFDLDCSVFWVQEDNTKTAAGRRQLVIPEHLRPRVRRARGMRAGAARMFPNLDRHKLLALVKRICRAAGVPVVTSQSMRGLHSSLAKVEGATTAAVARALGHADQGATAQQSYITREAAALGQQRAVLRVLDGGRSS